MKEVKNNQMFYFGCYESKGHFLYDTEYNKYYNNQNQFLPWSNEEIDTGLCPKETRKNGAAMIHRRGEYTAISFWDNSIDERQGSHSTFFIKSKTIHFNSFLRSIKYRFSEIYKRYNFNIFQYNCEICQGILSECDCCYWCEKTIDYCSCCEDCNKAEGDCICDS